MGAKEALDSGLARLLSAEPAADIEEPVVREWIEAEEAEFDRAILISDLIVSRIGRAPQEQAAAKSVSAAPPAPSRSRPAASGAPVIADMLDDMLSQQKRPRARSA